VLHFTADYLLLLLGLTLTWTIAHNRLPPAAAAPQVFMASRPSDADAVLAVRSKLRSNAGLRQAARQAGVPVYAIKSSSSSNLIRAFRTLLGQEPSAGGMLGGGAGPGGDEGEGATAAAAAAAAAAAGGSSIDLGGSRSSGDETDGEDGDELSAAAAAAAVTTSSSSPGKVGGAARALQQEEDGLEEARLAAEQIVMPLQQPVELLPRPEFVRKAQAALCERYGLAWEVVGSKTEARLRVSPSKAAAAVAGGAGEAAAAKDE
jgi:hypothetical protein